MEELHLSKNSALNDKAEDNKPTIELNRAGSMKRFLAFLMDSLCTIVVLIFLQTCAISYLFNAMFKVNDYQSRMVAREMESHLLVEDTTGQTNGIWITETYESDATASEIFEHFDTPIVYFYNTFTVDNDNINIKEYFDLIKESDLFVSTYTATETGYDLDTFSYTLGADVKAADIAEFYATSSSTGAFYTAVNALYHDDVVIKNGNAYFWFGIGEMATSGFLASLIFFLIIPICSKNGQTLGKRFLKLAPVNRVTGFRVKKWQVLLRYITFMLLEIVLTVFTFGITAIVSFTMLSFTKERACLHDYCSATIVIEINGKIYKDFDEYKTEVLDVENKNEIPAENIL